MPLLKSRRFYSERVAKEIASEKQPQKISTPAARPGLPHLIISFALSAVVRAMRAIDETAEEVRPVDWSNGHSFVT